MSLPGYTSPYSDDWSYGLAGAFANLSNVLLGSTVEVYTDLARPADVVQADLASQGWDVPLAVLEPYTLPPELAQATDFGRQVIDTVYDPAQPPYDPRAGYDEMLGQIAADPSSPQQGWAIEELQRRDADLDPDPFAGNLPPDVLGEILHEPLPPGGEGLGSLYPIGGVPNAGPNVPGLPGADERAVLQGNSGLPSTGGGMSILSEIAGAVLPDILGLFGGGTTAMPGSGVPGYTTGGQFGNGVTVPAGSPAQTTRGYRWNGTRWVKRRRMNPCNVHALRRALRRTEGFIKIEKRVDKIVQRAARAAGGARRHGFVRSKRKR